MSDIFLKLSHDMRLEHQKLNNQARAYQDIAVDLLEHLIEADDEIRAIEQAASCPHDDDCVYCNAIQRAELALNRFQLTKEVI